LTPAVHNGESKKGLVLMAVFNAGVFWETFVGTGWHHFDAATEMFDTPFAGGSNAKLECELKCSRHFLLNLLLFCW